MTFEERFWAKVMPEPMSGCWLWIGSVNNCGYGGIWKDGVCAKAHRVSYEMAKGKIPPGLDIDHKCKQRCCVNPDHLEAVTEAENVRRSSTKTHCLRGHEFNEENMFYSGGNRLCRKCHSIRNKESYRRCKARLVRAQNV